MLAIMSLYGFGSVRSARRILHLIPHEQISISRLIETCLDLQKTFSSIGSSEDPFFFSVCIATASENIFRLLYTFTAVILRL